MTRSYRLCITLEGWGSLSVEEGAEVVYALCTALALVDMAWRKQNPGVPLLYDAGVVYKPDAGIELQWVDTAALYARGYADCKALAAARVGELWAMGDDADFLVTTDSTNSTYHVQVVTARGYEDPSMRLGMGSYEVAS